MIEGKAKFWGQPNFTWDGEPRHFIRTFEKLRIGDSAQDAFLEVLRLNPEIAGFSLVLYQPAESSDGGMLKQAPIWFPRDMAKKEFLSKFSETNFINSGKNTIAAIGSMVSTKDGQIMHIPMLDYCIDPEEVALNGGDRWKIGIDELGQSAGAIRGAVLFSGRSYHLWSPNLLREDRWFNFMWDRLDADRRRHSVCRNPFYDKGFLKSSIGRGFSALRYSGYNGTGKDITPIVEYLIK